MDLLASAWDSRTHVAWGLAAALAAAIAFRATRVGERRALRLATGLLLLALGAHAVAVFLDGPDTVRRAGIGAALALGTLASIHVAAAWIFGRLLPAIGLSAPRIAQDLTISAVSLGWAFAWLRLGGLDPSQLFTTSAIITAVLAFAMQDTLGNVLGGVALQVDNSLRVGDWVRIDDVSGRVADVRWRYTAVETRARELVIIPNSWLMKNRFQVVRSAADGPIAWRRGVVLPVASDAKPAAVIAALEGAVSGASIDHVLQDPPPSAVLTDIAPGCCRYTLRYWMADPRFDDPCDSAVRVHALAALARAGIGLGIPQEERLTIKENQSWQQARRQEERNRRLAALRRTDLFAKLEPGEQETLADHLLHSPFAAGDVMTRQGAVAHWLYLVTHGDAQVSVEGPGGRLPVATLHAGDVFGEMGMLTGEPRGATVTAHTDVDCYRLDKEGFASIVRARPELATDIAAIMERRAQERDRRLAQAGHAQHAHGDLLGRILDFFALREGPH